MIDRPRLSRIAMLLAIGAMAGCASVGKITSARFASATLRTADGAPLGTARITGSGDRLTIAVAGTGLPAGVHGIHLHTVGRCDAPAFVTAGAHLNPDGHLHGTLNTGGSHLGDLPNLVVTQRGVGAVTSILQGTRKELARAVFDADGSTIVLHASPDDYKTDPSGNSGTRIACGVLTPG